MYGRPQANEKNPIHSRHPGPGTGVFFCAKGEGGGRKGEGIHLSGLPPSAFDLPPLARLLVCFFPVAEHWGPTLVFQDRSSLLDEVPADARTMLAVSTLLRRKRLPRRKPPAHVLTHRSMSPKLAKDFSLRRNKV